MSCFARWLRRWLWPVSGVVGLWLAVFVSGYAARFEDACAAVRADTLRLHIRAAGDTLADQTDKLRVRDAVVQLTGPLYAKAADVTAAKAAAARCLPVVALRTHCTLRRLGSRQPTAVYLTEEYFPTRQYGEYTLPAGQYAALCVEIGGGKGRNWWCCLYPQICAAACSGYADEQAQALVVGEYRLQFRLVEWWQQLRRRAAGESADETPSLVCTVD